MGILNLPHGGKYFGRRYCYYNLTYRKAQEHGKTLDRFCHMRIEKLFFQARKLKEKASSSHETGNLLKNLWFSHKVIIETLKKAART
ncbi:MAG: hypothetical protein AB1523_08005 [Bacillota bacterium]